MSLYDDAERYAKRLAWVAGVLVGSFLVGYTLWLVL